MFCKRLIKLLHNLPQYKNLNDIENVVRRIHSSVVRYNNNNKESRSKEVVEARSFEDLKTKTRNTYLDMVRVFIDRDSVHRRGHVEFIYAALKNMKEFGVHKDLEVYKALIDVLPKGKFIPQNIFQSEFMHYPKQQQCAVDLLEQMEDNGVLPDVEMEDMLLNVFGKRGFPLRKYWRMMYWMPKFKNLSPWPLPNPLPTDVFELAKLAMLRISSVDVQSTITIYETAHIADSIDETWIVSAQSPTQKKLLQNHNPKEPVYVEGGFTIWIKDNLVNYFVLRAKSPPPKEPHIDDTDDVSNIKVPLFGLPKKKHLSVVPSVHEQDDGIIMAVCATGTSSKDSLLSWIRHLENDGNPSLATVPVVFTLRSGTKEIATVDGENEKKIVETE